jgi:hypothetical protein
MSIGEPAGNITIRAGTGATFNDNTARIRYALPQTLQSGEHSFYATGLDVSHPGDKTKITFAYDGTGDPTTNDWRKNVEFRGGDHAAVTGMENVWRLRMITGDSLAHDDSIRVFPKGIHSSKIFFVRERWGGGSHSLFIAEDGPNGPVSINFSYGYTGVYNPRPMIAYMGAPPGRAGFQDASVSEMTVWDVYIGVIGNRPGGPSTRGLTGSDEDLP